jgi:hypothetical protein
MVSYETTIIRRSPAKKRKAITTKEIKSKRITRPKN